MEVFLNSDGTLQIVSPTPFTQGSNNAQSITLIAPVISDYTSMGIKFVLPNGETINGGVMTSTTFTYDNLTLRAYTYPLSTTITNQPGNVICSFVAYSQAGDILATYSITIPITANAEIVLPATPDLDWYAQILAAYASIQGDMVNKQDKQDTTLETTSKTVVGAINELNTETGDNTTDIATNTSDITQNTIDIAYLYQHISQPEDYIGAMTGAALPTDTQLNEFTLANTSPSRNPKNGDVILFTLEVSGGTDLVYKYIYSGSGWVSYQIPSVESASNGTLGLVEGTYGIDSTNNLLVNIANGEILNIYIKDANSSYVDLRVNANNNTTSIASIIAGTTNAGQAVKAIQDQVGNIINEYYLSATEGATKAFVKAYALPKTFTDTYYYTSTGIVTDIPTQATAQFSVNVNSVGEVTLFNLQRLLVADYNFTKNNTYASKVYITSSVNTTARFKLYTYGKKATDTSWTLLDSVYSDPIVMTADSFYSIPITSNFGSLGNNELELSVGDNFRQEFVIDSEESTARTFEIYSNETYPSTFNLNAQSVVLNINYAGQPKEVSLASTDFTLNTTSGLYEATILQTTHMQPVGYDYIVYARYNESATSYRDVEVDTSVNTGGDITVYATTNEAVKIFIASAVIVENVYKTYIGDGENTSYVIAHHLNTRDILYMFYSVSTNQVITPTSITLTSTNSITVVFDTAPSVNDVRVVIRGEGQ